MLELIFGVESCGTGFREIAKSGREDSDSVEETATDAGAGEAE